LKELIIEEVHETVYEGLTDLAISKFLKKLQVVYLGKVQLEKLF